MLQKSLKSLELSRDLPTLQKTKATNKQEATVRELLLVSIPHYARLESWADLWRRDQKYYPSHPCSHFLSERDLQTALYPSKVTKVDFRYKMKYAPVCLTQAN